MCQLDVAGIQFAMTLPNRLEPVPVSMGCGRSTSLRYWLIWDVAATAGAEAVMAASL